MLGSLHLVVDRKELVKGSRAWHMVAEVFLSRASLSSEDVVCGVVRCHRACGEGEGCVVAAEAFLKPPPWIPLYSCAPIGELVL